MKKTFFLIIIALFSFSAVNADCLSGSLTPNWSIQHGQLCYGVAIEEDLMCVESEVDEDGLQIDGPYAYYDNTLYYLGNLVGEGKYENLGNGFINLNSSIYLNGELLLNSHKNYELIDDQFIAIDDKIYYTNGSVFPLNVRLTEKHSKTSGSGIDRKSIVTYTDGFFEITIKGSLEYVACGPNTYEMMYNKPGINLTSDTAKKIDIAIEKIFQSLSSHLANRYIDAIEKRLIFSEFDKYEDFSEELNVRTIKVQFILIYLRNYLESIIE